MNSLLINTHRNVGITCDSPFAAAAVATVLRSAGTALCCFVAVDDLKMHLLKKAVRKLGEKKA